MKLQGYSNVIHPANVLNHFSDNTSAGFLFPTFKRFFDGIPLLVVYFRLVLSKLGIAYQELLVLSILPFLFIVKMSSSFPLLSKMLKLQPYFSFRGGRIERKVLHSSPRPFLSSLDFSSLNFFVMGDRKRREHHDSSKLVVYCLRDYLVSYNCLHLYL